MMRRLAVVSALATLLSGAGVWGFVPQVSQGKMGRGGKEVAMVVM